MRSKAKKIYCSVSFIVAVIVFTLVLTIGLTGQTAYASPTDMPDNSGSLSVTQDQDPGDIRSDDVNGLSIIYNNENGTICNSPDRTVANDHFAGALHPDHDDILYTDHCRTALSACGARYPDNAAKSGACGAGAVSDIYDHVAGFFRDQ